LGRCREKTRRPRRKLPRPSSIAAYKGRYYRYPACIRLIKDRVFEKALATRYAGWNTPLGKQIESASQNKRKTLSDPAETKGLSEQLAQQKQKMTNLLDQVTQVSQQAETSEPLLSKQLYDTLRKTSQANVDNSLSTASELLKRNFVNEAGQFEQRARKDIEELKQGVEHAAESVLGDDTEALRMAKRELDDLSRQLDQEIAALAGQPRQARPLGPDHQAQRHVQVGAVELLGALVILDAHDPDAGLLQFADRLRQVGDDHDPQMLGRARRGVDDRRRNLGGAAAGQHYAMHTHGLGRAQQRAHILGVLQMIKQQQQRRLLAFRS
jgi:hypothetical protein